MDQQANLTSPQSDSSHASVTEGAIISDEVVVNTAPSGISVPVENEPQPMAVSSSDNNFQYADPAPVAATKNSEFLGHEFPPVPEPVFNNPQPPLEVDTGPLIEPEVLESPKAKRPRRDVLMPINLQEENSLVALLEVCFCNLSKLYFH